VGDKVTYETNGTDIIYYTYDASNNLVSMNLNGVEYYYIRNAQGDIIGLFDKTGTQVVSYTYDTWGKSISTTGTLASTVGVKNPYRYRGYRYDTETGLYYLQSRYYNPEFCRMFNADDTNILTVNLDNLTDKNLFAYCDNNPVMRVDNGGDYWRAAFAGGGAAAYWSFGSANFWNPVGWAVISVGAGVAVGFGIHRMSRNKKPKAEREYNQEAEHTKKTKSKKNKHQEGQTRKKIDPGTHIVAVGADMEGKQEIDSLIFRNSKIVVDSKTQCLQRGETRNPFVAGIISEESIYAEIGEILLSLKPGRVNEDEITIFDTTGMGIQDNKVAKMIYDKAIKFKKGQFMNLI